MSSTIQSKFISFQNKQEEEEGGSARQPRPQWLRSFVRSVEPDAQQPLRYSAQGRPRGRCHGEERDTTLAASPRQPLQPTPGSSTTTCESTETRRHGEQGPQPPDALPQVPDTTSRATTDSIQKTTAGDRRAES